jgi:hypothetical protein
VLTLAVANEDALLFIVVQLLLADQAQFELAAFR